MPKKNPGLDDLISFQELAKHVPPKGVHWMTAYRWATRGLKVNGRNLKLRSQRVGNRRLTTLRWYNEFSASQQDHEDSYRDAMSANFESTSQQLDRELSS